METNNLLAFGWLLVSSLIIMRVVFDNWGKARKSVFFKNLVEYSTSDKVLTYL